MLVGQLRPFVHIGLGESGCSGVFREEQGRHPCRIVRYDRCGGGESFTTTTREKRRFAPACMSFRAPENFIAVAMSV